MSHEKKKAMDQEDIDPEYVVDVDSDLNFYGDDNNSVQQVPTQRRRSRLGVPAVFADINQETWTDLQANRDSFVLPEKYEDLGYRVQPLPPRTYSVALQYGVRLVPPESSKLNPVWKCLFSECFNNEKFWLKLGKGTTANATGHLLHRHGIQSKKTLVMKQNKRQRVRGARVNKSLLTQDPQRFYALAVTKLIVAKNLTLDFGETKELASIIGQGFRQVRSEVIKRSLLEFYVYVRNLLAAELQKAQQCFEVPFLHLSADVYKNTLVNQSFLGIRVAFVDSQYRALQSPVVTKSFNLGIRSFRPSSQHRKTNQVSDLLHVWANSIFTEYNLIPKAILTATTDGGSDIKRLIEKKIGIPREWCLPHLIHLAVQDAFGVSVKCKNRPVFEITRDIRRVIEFFNKSQKATQALREAQISDLGRPLKLVNFAHQRWASACRMYGCFLRSFSVLQEYFMSQKTPFKWPGTLVRRTIEELYTILKKVSDTVKFAQNDVDIAASPLSAVWMMFLELYPGSELSMLSPSMNERQNTVRKYDDLTDVSKRTLELLRDGLQRRFFDRYHPILALQPSKRRFFYNHTARIRNKIDDANFRFPYVLDFTWMLIPKYRQGQAILRIIEKMVEKLPPAQLPVLHKTAGGLGLPERWSKEDLIQEHFNNIKSLLWERVRQLAVQHISFGDDSAGRESFRTSNVATSHTSEQVTAQEKQQERFNPDGFFGNTANTIESGARASTIHDRIDSEIRTYLHKQESGLDQIGLLETLVFWQKESRGHRFPALAQIALAFLGVKASSAGIERDFSPAEDIISSKRSNLDAWVIEVLLCLKLNYKLLPNDMQKIKPLSKVDRLALVEKLKAQAYFEDLSVDGKESSTRKQVSSTYQDNCEGYGSVSEDTSEDTSEDERDQSEE